MTQIISLFNPFDEPATPVEPNVSADAIISACGTYRYALWRTWNNAVAPLGFIGLNPSTADARQDDPTIRRCIGFARRMGCGGIVMMNTMAYRATDPKQVIYKRCEGVDVVGPENDVWLDMLVPTCHKVVAAWGFNGAVMCGRDRVIMERFKSLWCFGKTEGGYPRHPLYLRNDAKLEPYN